MSTAVTMKAPTAPANPPSTAPEVASSAPPGVDQAMLIGCLVLRLRMIAQAPMEIDSAISPDAASPGRTEERRVGKAGVGRCRCRGSRDHYKKNKDQNPP